jgi:hypothetical protein
LRTIDVALTPLLKGRYSKMSSGLFASAVHPPQSSQNIDHS